MPVYSESRHCLSSVEKQKMGKEDSRTRKMDVRHLVSSSFIPSLIRREEAACIVLSEVGFWVESDVQRL